ncbi:MAG: hypothetical protein GTO18_10590 [Anaerolineales bacterium]|nr:hypothetical protein [Anaerolineales bacterium]
MKEQHSSVPEGSPEGNGVSARTGCLVSVLFGLCLTVIVCFTLALIIRGEVSYARSDLEVTRLWIVQGTAGNGLGFSTSRVLEYESDENQTCVETNVRFFLISSEEAGFNTDYCECYTFQDGSWVSAGTCEAE